MSESAADASFMRQALACARRAGTEGEVPVGAVLTRGGEIVAHGHNRPVGLDDPSAHAEIQALRAAGQALGNYRLVDTVMYVTLEPCIMCAGALVHARVARVVFGAYDPKTGAAGSVFDILASERHNHHVAVTPGVLAEECGSLVRAFFKQRRAMAHDDGGDQA